MSFERTPSGGALEAEDLAVNLGMRFDANGPLVLPPGGAFTTPLVAFTASAGDLDEAANQLHRFQHDFAFARTAANQPPLVQFNSWYPFPGPGTVADMKRCADVAADLGADVFVLDASWFSTMKRTGGQTSGTGSPRTPSFPTESENFPNTSMARASSLGYGWRSKLPASIPKLRRSIRTGFSAWTASLTTWAATT